jgi:hypothetical protein
VVSVICGDMWSVICGDMRRPGRVMLTGHGAVGEYHGNPDRRGKNAMDPEQLVSGQNTFGLDCFIIILRACLAGLNGPSVI